MNETILVALAAILIAYGLGLAVGRMGLKQFMPTKPKRFTAKEDPILPEWDYAVKNSRN